MPTAEDTIDIQELDFYPFFTKYSLMEEYGFTSGLWSRIFRKILPVVPEQHTLDYLLLQNKRGISMILDNLEYTTLAQSPIADQLNLAIKALCAKVVAFGLDNNIKSKYNILELNSEPFEHLLERVDQLHNCEEDLIVETLVSLQAIESLIIELRKNKQEVGINFHLTMTTRRMLEYVSRIKELLNLKRNIFSKGLWEKLFLEYIAYSGKRNSVRRYIDRHSDLVALEIVEHTSHKGAKYIAENREEYRLFFRKALLGGGIIAIFALFKIFLESYELSQLRSALYFSVNYALCFIIAKQLGGTIATKQPAMTASTIAKNIDKDDDLKIDSIKSIILLIRKVTRSQFISIIGNFLMALSLSALLMAILKLTTDWDWNRIVPSEYLISNVVPSAKLVFFAATAGVFLALSGLISGYVDNKVIASRIAYRIRHNRLFFKSKRLGHWANNKAGILMSNISLGFFLGSAFLLSNFVPFEVDIRHIAFSSANAGYAIINGGIPLTTILLALAGALIIGFVNLIVSFAATLYLALKSRGASLKLIPRLLYHLGRDLLLNPLYYFGKIEGDAVT